jgi:hypothetical protein
VIEREEDGDEDEDDESETEKNVEQCTADSLEKATNVALQASMRLLIHSSAQSEGFDSVRDLVQKQLSPNNRRRGYEDVNSNNSGSVLVVSQLIDDHVDESEHIEKRSKFM